MQSINEANREIFEKFFMLLEFDFVDLVVDADSIFVQVKSVLHEYDFES